MKLTWRHRASLETPHMGRFRQKCQMPKVVTVRVGGDFVCTPRLGFSSPNPPRHFPGILLLQALRPANDCKSLEDVHWWSGIPLRGPWTNNTDPRSEIHGIPGLRHSMEERCLSRWVFPNTPLIMSSKTDPYQRADLKNRLPCSRESRCGITEWTLVSNFQSLTPDLPLTRWVILSQLWLNIPSL